MILIGIEQLSRLVDGTFGELKMVFNERGAILFTKAQQHRDMKADGISYEDNYAGNALAAMLRREEIEIRFHQCFPDAIVAQIVHRLISMPEFSPLSLARVTYQGRVLSF